MDELHAENIDLHHRLVMIENSLATEIATVVKK